MTNPGTALFICGPCSLGMRAADRKKAGYPQISQKDADFEVQIGETRAWPWTRCRAMRRALLRVGPAGLSMRFGSAGLSMRFISTQHKAIEAEASVCTTLRENGTARAGAGPRPCRRCARCSKMRTDFSKVRILENAGDSFEDAHPFARCARKTEHLRKETGSVTGFGRFACLVLHSRTFPDAYARLTNSFKCCEGLAIKPHLSPSPNVRSFQVHFTNFETPAKHHANTT